MSAVVSLLDRLRYSFLHQVLHWGFPEKNPGPALARVDGGFLRCADCRFCSQVLLQDSYGDWFHVRREKR
jgi:hypothetical protein